jgi:uncharacterized delta-60 repeat protein
LRKKGVVSFDADVPRRSYTMQRRTDLQKLALSPQVSAPRLLRRWPKPGQNLRSTLLWQACTLMLSTLAGTSAWAQANQAFGPFGSTSAFYTLENNHTATLYSRAVRRDNANRIWMLQDWATPGNADTDCAVQRHVQNARMLDMDFGGSTEATQRLYFDVGGNNADVCFDMEFSPGGKAVVAATATTATGSTGAFARLMPNGALDTSFGVTGKVNLQALGVPSSNGINLRDLVVLPSGGMVACGYTDVAGDLNMFVVQLTASGQLDTSFATVGYRQIPISNLGDKADTCLAMERTASGKLLLVGRAKNGIIATDNDFAAVRLNSDGTLDGSFGNSGVKIIPIDSTASADDRVYDVAIDPVSGRSFLFGDSVGTSGFAPTVATVVALNSAGQLDNSFGNLGKVLFRYSDRAILRGVGSSGVRRGVISGGNLYIVGNNTNHPNMQADFGTYDVAVAALHANDGSFLSSYGSNGVSYHSFGMTQYSNIEAPAAGGVANRNKIDEFVGDADISDGRLTIAFMANRFPAITGVEPIAGAFAPAMAQLTVTPAQDGFDGNGFSGVDAPDINLAPALPVPTGYQRYCSVLDPVSGAAGFEVGTLLEDPCQTLKAQNANYVIQRAGLWNPNGQNQAMRVCGTDIKMSRGQGTSAILNVLSLQTLNCVYTVAPQYLPIFERPYEGAHVAASSSAFFTHTAGFPSAGTPGPFVSDFGQPIGDHLFAHSVDFLGRQQCFVDANGVHQQKVKINEPAIDLGLPEGRNVESMAPGIVMQAVPRYVINYAASTLTSNKSSPYQREFFVGHRVGSGIYQEEFVSYYAHTSDTLVRIGQIVGANSVLGHVGTTGSSSGFHLHYGVTRYKNLSFSKSFALSFDRLNFADQSPINSSVDPYGWKAPLITGNDPWANRNNNAGAFSSDLWLNNSERPPTN